ncbi:dual specificity protein phosphatase 18 isoform X2 [Suncus etruscus]|uniref:dual specificity protein phosphatase 18 isoform X2 n=1 Tax=Suncus etruscus TaxID=109475 RepID=UPI0021109563|nr:dual specificity protein phosphatase 18 isoform X2 [Suncus etruscus]
MTSHPSALPVQFRPPTLSGLSRVTSSLYISNGAAANNKVMLSGNQITSIINVSIHGGDEAGAHAASLCRRGEPLGHPLPCLPHEIPHHVAARSPHMDQGMPAHHPAQQWLLGATHPL